MKRFETFYKYFYVNYRFLRLFDEVFVGFRVAVILGVVFVVLDFGGGIVGSVVYL